MGISMFAPKFDVILTLSQPERANFSHHIGPVPGIHCKYLRSHYDQIAVIHRVSIPKYYHWQCTAIGSVDYSLDGCRNYDFRFKSKNYYHRLQSSLLVRLQFLLLTLTP